MTCAALGDGTQTVLFRKGGIAEGPFKTRAKEFLLFPTKFHTEEKLLQPQAAQDYAAIMDFAPGDQLEFSVIAKVTGCWTTFDPTVVEKTASLHIWNEKFLDSRLKWRPKVGSRDTLSHRTIQALKHVCSKKSSDPELVYYAYHPPTKQVPITVLELRTYRLAPPARTPSQKEYFGCFSWVELQDAMPDVASRWAEVQPVLSEEAFAARQRALRAVLEGMEVEALSVDDH